MQTHQRDAQLSFRPRGAGDLRRAHAEFHRTGDLVLRQSLVETYQPLAFALATRYTRHREAQDDLNQCALLGLVHAVDRFDPDRGVKFTTFAWITITGELKRHYRDTTWAVRVPRALQELFLAATRASDELTLELGRAPTIGEIAERADATEEEVEQALDVAGAYSPASLDAPAVDGAPRGNGLVARDEALGAVDDRLALGPLVKRLPAREQLILHLRFVEEMSQAQIGRVVGMRQMQVSRVLARTLAALREWMDSNPPEAA